LALKPVKTDGLITQTVR